jgi:hypothetical protein
MPICPNGSAPQSGVAAEYIIDNAFMTSLLPDGLEWLGQFLPFIPPLRFSTALFCAEDPPGYPDMSLVEWAALVAGSPAQAAQESGRQVAQALYNILWYRLCECLVDSTPAIPSAPSEPTNIPAINPPGVVSPTQSVPCLAFGPLSHAFTNGNGTFNRGGLVLANTTIRTVRVIVQNQVTSGAGWTLSTSPRFDLSAGGQTNLPTFTTPPNTTSTRVFTVPPDNTVS